MLAAKVLEFEGVEDIIKPWEIDQLGGIIVE